LWLYSNRSTIKIYWKLYQNICTSFVNKWNFSSQRFLYYLSRYGNTHSETSLCAQQSTKFREEARDIIKKSVNANQDDVLLFTGTGSTGAVHTLVDNFDLNNETVRKNTVVIISAFEHHSNILPWKETGVEVR
jgi:selenocysteine lyase/cysteine desulfurase